MARCQIDNPILNGPYDEPMRHFDFDGEGLADRREDLTAIEALPAALLRQGFGGYKDDSAERSK